jgi:hypothetical protein
MYLSILNGIRSHAVNAVVLRRYSDSRNLLKERECFLARIALSMIKLEPLESHQGFLWRAKLFCNSGK